MWTHFHLGICTAQPLDKRTYSTVWWIVVAYNFHLGCQNVDDYECVC